MKKTKNWIKELYDTINEYDCKVSTAKYILGRSKKGELYEPHKKHYSEVTYEEVKDFDLNTMSKLPRGNFKALYVWHKGRYYSVATVKYLQEHKCNKPAGYVISHLDGDVTNDDINNLVLIPAEKVTSKGYSKNAGHNQYTKKENSEKTKDC